jgi:hypothetical protein
LITPSPNYLVSSYSKSDKVALTAVKICVKDMHAYEGIDPKNTSGVPSM